MASLTMSVPMNDAYLLIVNKATKLRIADTLGSSDPYVKITCPAAPTCLDEKTAVIQRNLNPVWGECFLVCLPSTVPAVIKFSVYDSDKGTFIDAPDDFLGQAGVDLNATLSDDSDLSWRSVDLPLTGDKAKGTLNVLVKRYGDVDVTIESAAMLRNADGPFGKSDPYAKVKGLTSRDTVWGATKTVRDNLNPTFNESFTIDLLNKMPLGGNLKACKIELWDEDDKKQGGPSDDPLGVVTIPWISVFPDAGAPPLGALKLVSTGARSGSTVTVSTSMRQSELGGISNSLLQTAITSPTAAASDEAASQSETNATDDVQTTNTTNAFAAAASLAATAAAVAKVFRVEKTACKANLVKGYGFKIADCTDNIADKYTMGLAWDVTNGQNIDLDASCVWLDASLQQIDTVWFQKLRSADGSMIHQGDEREGDEEGDDESINFDLEKVNPRAVYLCFCINSFSGQQLSDVASAKCRLYNTETENEVASFDISDNENLKCTAMLMCILYRSGPNNDWYMYAVGEPAQGRTVQDNVDEFQEFLTKHPLASMSRPNEGQPTKIAKIKVPEATGPNNSIGFKLPSGGTEQVKLPPTAKAGDTIEVPIIDVFIA